MNKPKIDLRVRITKQMLRKSLTELLRQKPIQKITVAKLCEIASLNRCTFYSHYTDIYDLLSKIEEEVFEEFQKTLQEFTLTENIQETKNPFFIYIQMFEFLKRNSDMCIILLGENCDRRFVTKLFELAKDKSMTEYAKVYKKATRKQLEMFYTFVASGCIGILELWINSGMKETTQEMAEITNTIVMKGIRFLS